MSEMIDPEKDILLIEYHWELIVIIHSHNLNGVNGEMKVYVDFYNKIAQSPDCPCNKNHLAYIDNIKDHLNKFLKKEEIEKLKHGEEIKLVHVKKKDGTILEF